MAELADTLNNIELVLDSNGCIATTIDFSFLSDIMTQALVSKQIHVRINSISGYQKLADLLAVKPSYIFELPVNCKGSTS